MKQPNTWDKTQPKSFCCSEPHLCCGVGLCCNSGEYCCSGWKSSGSCCSDSSKCLSDGTCAESTFLTEFPDLIWSLPLLLCCCCLWCRLRIAAALRRRQNLRQQQIMIFNRFFDTIPISNNLQAVEVPNGLDSSILNTFPIMKFEEEKFPLEADHSCSICLEEYIANEELRVLPCNHIFHVACIDKWLDKKIFLSFM